MSAQKLIREYGLGRCKAQLRDAAKVSIDSLSELEIERLMVRGQLLGWKRFLGIDTVPGSPLPVFDHTERGPEGHMKRFIDLAWEGFWMWDARVGDMTLVNHYSSRAFYDLLNRSAAGRAPASYNMIIGPASSGKTSISALYAVSMFLVFRDEITVKLVSTSATSAEDRIWGQAVDLFTRSWWGKNPRVPGQGAFLAIQGREQRILFLIEGTDKVRQGAQGVKRTAALPLSKNYLRGIQLVPVQRGVDGQGAVKRLMGIKAPQKLLIVDECGDCDTSIFGENLLMNWSVARQFAQVVYMWNPKWSAPRAVSYTEPEGGWVDPDYSMESPGWRTRRDGWCTSLNGLDTPNLDFRKENDIKRDVAEPSAPFPFLLTVTDIELARKKAPEGDQSEAFMQMAVGFLADDTKSNTVISHRMVQENGADKPAEWTGENSYYLLGCDPSLSGGDRFTICVGQIGYGYDKQKRKRVMLEVDSFRYVPFVQGDIRGTHTAEAGQVRYVQEMAAEMDAGPESIASDCTGVSMGFVNACEMALGGQQFHRVHFAAAPSERPAGPGESRTAAEKFADSKSEICFSVRDYLPWIRGITNEAAIDQGSQRTYKVKGRDKIVVEGKRDFKTRMGGSPDEYDALSILVDLAKTMGLGTETLLHPKVIQGRRGRDSRIVVKARYQRGLDEEARAGMARYGVRVA